MKKIFYYLLIGIILLSNIQFSTIHATTNEEINGENLKVIQLQEDYSIQHIELTKGSTLFVKNMNEKEVEIQYADTIEILPSEIVEVMEQDNLPFYDDANVNYTSIIMDEDTYWSSQNEQSHLHIPAGYPVQVVDKAKEQYILIGNIAFYQSIDETQQESKADEEVIIAHKEETDQKDSTGSVNNNDNIQDENSSNNEDEVIDPWRESNARYFQVVEDNLPVYDNRTGELVKIGELVKGDTYPINRDYGNWHVVTYGDIKGYVLKSKTIPSKSSEIRNENKRYKTTNRTITVPNRVSVYDNSGSNLQEFGILEKGSKIKITSDYGNWWRIIFAGRIGYIQKSEVNNQFLKSDKYFIPLENNLPIYDNRTGKLIKIGELVKGQSYPIARDYGNWHEIRFGSYKGYVRKDKTAPSTGSTIRNQNSTYKNTNREVKVVHDIPVYDNTLGKLVKFGVITKNTNIAILSDYGNWWRVLFSDRVGYISKTSTEINFIKSDRYFKADQNLPVYDNRSGKLVEIGKLKSGQTYRRVSDYGNWHRIQFNNHYGYVKKDGTSVAINPRIPNLNKSYKRTSERFRASIDLPVYDNSSGKLVEFGTIRKNQTYYITNDYGNWYRIIFADRVGYINKEQVTGLFNKNTKYFQAKTNAPIYDNRSGSLVKVGEVIAGQAYERVRDYGNWHQIRFGNYYGYVHKDNTLPLNKYTYKNRRNNTFSLGTLRAKRNTHIYDNTGSKLVPFATLQSGKQLTVTREYGKWLEVNIAGRYGYISKSDVTANIMVAKNIVNPKTTYTYEMMQDDIEQLKAQYPGLITSKVIGKSVDGRNIYAVKLGKGKTEIFMNGSHHAREWLTTNLLMEMIDTYSQAYVKNTTVGGYNARKILNNTSIWFVPMVNPDGVSLVQKGAFSAKRPAEVIRINGGSTNFNRWKANIRGVDLTRQYLADWGNIRNNRTSPSYMNHKGIAPLNEPETKAVYNFTNQHNFKTAVSYHSSGEVLYWDYKLKSGTVQRSLSYRLANMIRNKTGYRLVMAGPNPSGGGYTDWFIQSKRLPAFTPEISPYVGERPVPISYFDSIWRKNQAIGLMLAEEAYRR